MRDREGDKKIKRKREGDRDWERKKHKGKEKDRDKEKERWWRWKGQRKKESLSKQWEIENRTGQDTDTDIETGHTELQIVEDSQVWTTYGTYICREIVHTDKILLSCYHCTFVSKIFTCRIILLKICGYIFFIVDAFKWIFVSLLMKNRFGQ